MVTKGIVATARKFSSICSSAGHTGKTRCHLSVFIFLLYAVLFSKQMSV